MDFDFKFEEGHILNGLDKMLDVAQVKMRVYGDFTAKHLEAKAKQNANWKDHTGDARRTIQGEAKHAADINTVRMTLHDGVYYGKYLEYCNGGKYAIIEPTIDSEAPNVVKGLANLF